MEFNCWSWKVRKYQTTQASSFLVEFDSIVSYAAFLPSMLDGVDSVRSTCIIEDLFAVVLDISTETVGLESDDGVGASAPQLLFGNSVKEPEATDSSADCWEHKSNRGLKVCRA